MAGGINNRFSITDVAKTIGVTPRTIMRWEKSGKIRRSKRDWRGWRFYQKEDIEEIRNFYESAYEFEENEGALVNFAKNVPAIVFALFISTAIFAMFTRNLVYASSNFAGTKGVVETPNSIDINLDELPVIETPQPSINTEDAVKYTLGPNDVISIEVRRHPEFSGEYKINSEGKIEYKFVGDIFVTGLTKLQLKERLMEILSQFLTEPEVDVSIKAYLSKVFYVVGEVGQPGKFYMMGNTISVREALFQAGLPAQTAALRGCRLITPDNSGKNNYIVIDADKLLYKGDLKQNLEMKPGDVLYIPATMMAKLIRIISPVTTTTGQVTGAARGY